MTASPHSNSSPDRYFKIAGAKINLALHITCQREDGFHELDSLVCFGNFGDKIIVTSNNCTTRQVSLKIKGEFAHVLNGSNEHKAEENLIIMAAHALARQLQSQGFSCPGVDIILEKNLPVASGLGGGSGDAASALLLLRDFWRAPDANLVPIARKLGADVPMCLDDRPKRIRGIGHHMTLLSLNLPLVLLLINPNIELPTHMVFAALENKVHPAIASDIDDLLQTPPDTPNKSKSIHEIADCLSKLRNDLQIPATLLVPKIGQIISQLQNQPHCLLARMSGSGSTCFGIFDNQEHANDAMRQIKAHHGDWWFKIVSTIANG